MNALLILLPVSLVWIAFALLVLFWAVRQGQFENLDSASFQALEDDAKPEQRAPHD
jgi:cbb3-type cytochrome oxidase maturation protein